MTVSPDNISIETFESIKNIAAAHARGEASADDVKKLHRLDPKLWRTALAATKRELEVQMTALQSRLNKNNNDYKTGTISEAVKNDTVNREMQWRSKASRFLASIEGDILYVNYVIHQRQQPDVRSTNTDRIASESIGE